MENQFFHQLLVKLKMVTKLSQGFLLLYLVLHCLFQKFIVGYNIFSFILQNSHSIQNSASDSHIKSNNIHNSDRNIKLSLKLYISYLDISFQQ